MNRIILFLMAFAVIFGSCSKSASVSLTYSVTNDTNDSALEDIYIPDSGVYPMNVLVKFLHSLPNQNDTILLVVTGLPANVTVSPDSFRAVPTYNETFTFTSNNATQGVYPATITAYTHIGLPQAYNFNIHVIPPDCAALFWGTLTGSNACTSRSFVQTATGATGGSGVLIVNNFGGYGTACNVTVNFNCDNNTLSIAKANYGNGVILQGTGTYNSDSMIINYTAFSTPTGGTEGCTLSYKK